MPIAQKRGITKVGRPRDSDYPDSGIGLATARLFIAEDAQVAITWSGQPFFAAGRIKLRHWSQELHGLVHPDYHARPLNVLWGDVFDGRPKVECLSQVSWSMKFEGVNSLKCGNKRKCLRDL